MRSEDFRRSLRFRILYLHDIKNAHLIFTLEYFNALSPSDARSHTIDHQGETTSRIKTTFTGTNGILFIQNNVNFLNKYILTV